MLALAAARGSADRRGWPPSPIAGPASHPPPLPDLVVYELHIGTFSPEGTFDAAIP